jgi:hypothetical protein
MAGTRKTHPVSWLKAALHELEKFPEGTPDHLPHSADDRGRGSQGGYFQSRCRA